MKLICYHRIHSILVNLIQVLKDPKEKALKYIQGN